MNLNVNIKENIKDLLNNSNKAGVYNIIVNNYLDSINELLKSGFTIRIIIKEIEKDLNIEHGTVNYHSFRYALTKHTKGEKKRIAQPEKIERQNIFDKAFKKQPEVIENDISSELDKINTNITGLEKRENIFDKAFKKT